MNYPYQSHFQYDAVPGRCRVVVTGLGAVSAAGTGTEALWDALVAGRSCIGAFTRYDLRDMDMNVAGEVKDFDASKLIPTRLRPRRMARQTQFAVVAAMEALADAGLTPAALAGRRVAVIVGSAAGTMEMLEENTLQVNRGGPGSLSPASNAGSNIQPAPVAVAALREMPATNVIGLMNNCTSGVDAIGTAVDLIRFGRYDLVVAGGAEAPLSYMVTSVLTASGMCSKSDRPDEACRPFDRNRDGGVIGEGAGMVILESAGAARDRGAKPYVEITGTHSCPDERRDLPSSGLEYTMRGALENAGCGARDIDFISAWGCGDPLSDRCETDAIKQVFGDAAYHVAISSIKGAIGIPLGASGPLQLVVLALSHRRHLLPPPVNWRHGDLDCDLDYVGPEPRRVRLRRTLLNAHGLSGGNISIVLTNPD